MSTNNNTLFPESIDAILAEKYIFNSMEDELKVLIVEGIDDIQVISKYYFFKKNCEIPFRICIGEDNSGKRSAISSFYKYRDKIPNIICLLDRDLDFIFSRNENDERIVYYDFTRVD